MKLALVQMLVEPGRKESNLARAERHITEAATRGPQIILLPEAMPLGWTHPSARTEADSIPDGESCSRLCRAAQAQGVFICAGIIERAGGKIFNSAVLINPAGEVIVHHRKIYELELAQDLYARGDRLSVTETPFGKIGLEPVLNFLEELSVQCKYIPALGWGCRRSERVIPAMSVMKSGVFVSAI